MTTLVRTDRSPTYEGLKLPFVDAQRFIETLRRDGFTGGIEIRTSRSTTEFRFHEGFPVPDTTPNSVAAVQALLTRITQLIDSGDGELDVYNWHYTVAPTPQGEASGGLPRHMLRAAARLVPRDHRERWLSEWLAEAASISGWRSRFGFATSVLRAAPRMAWVIRRATRRTGA